MFHCGRHINFGRMKNPPRSDDAVADLLAVARELRDKNGGCPWDLEQTHESLAKYAIEEVYELTEVIEGGLSPETEADFREELGDVLFQVVIQAQLATERGAFAFADVARGIADKLISRHPHVFGDVIAVDSQEVLKNWEAIKAREREKKQKRVTAVDGVPKMLPALHRAERLLEKSARAGRVFNLTNVGANITDEKQLGDLLFEIVENARRNGLHAEAALRSACNQFEAGFKAPGDT